MTPCKVLCTLFLNTGGNVCGEPAGTPHGEPGVRGVRWGGWSRRGGDVGSVEGVHRRVGAAVKVRIVSKVASSAFEEERSLVLKRAHPLPDGLSSAFRLTALAGHSTHP